MKVWHEVRCAMLIHPILQHLRPELLENLAGDIAQVAKKTAEAETTRLASELVAKMCGTEAKE